MEMKNMKLTWDNLATCQGCGREMPRGLMRRAGKGRKLCADCYAAKRRECKRAFAARKYARVKASRNKQAS